MRCLAAVVNVEPQKEILGLLSDFEVVTLAEGVENYLKFPLLINFDSKKLRRCTSITCCAGLSSKGMIERDYNVVKATIEQYLQEKAAGNTL